MKLLGLIENLSNDGCTDYEAINISVDLLRKNYLRKKLGSSLDRNKLEKVIEEAKNINEQEPNPIIALTKLSKRERQCYLRHYVELRSFSNIAMELGISKSSVNNYIRRAREKLKEA